MRHPRAARGRQQWSDQYGPRSKSVRTLNPWQVPKIRLQGRRGDGQREREGELIDCNPCVLLSIGSPPAPPPGKVASNPSPPRASILSIGFVCSREPTRECETDGRSGESWAGHCSDSMGLSCVQCPLSTVCVCVNLVLLSSGQAGQKQLKQ